MHNTTTILNITMACIMTTSLTAAALGPGGGRGGQGHRPPTPAVDTALDVDGDEVISADEIADAALALIKLDTDNDGSLSFAEYMGFPPGGNGAQAPPAADRGGPSGPPPAPPLVSALDTSGDEVIDGDELASAPSSLLELDTNDDGELQPDEYRPRHFGGPRGGGAEGR